MSFTNKLLCTIAIALFPFANHLSAQEVKNGLTWYNDINKVCELSNTEHKPIFAFFTGSDWCIWCHRLEQNVFDKPGFKEWAKNVILFEVDFPRTRKLPETLAKQNNSLQEFFKIPGFPTCWIFNMTKDPATNKFNITGLGSLGYPQTDPEHAEAEFLDLANKVLNNKK